MVFTFKSLLGALAIAVASVDAAALRGFGWATNDAYAPNIGDKPLIKWYHHWQDGVVAQMPSKVEYVPMFWGPAKWDKWSARLTEMRRSTPKYLMAFNEPDVDSQANMNPWYAADLYMQEINPWASKGTKLGSPAIVWNLDWMNTFLNEVKNKGGRVDFICLHWYGSWADLQGFKNFVTTTRSRFNKNIWLTEIGITSASNPSQQQVKNFMMNAFAWLDTQPYIERAGWFGAFESNRAPDSFATGKNALFNPGGSLTDMAYWYGYSSRPDKRSVSARHHVLAREDSSDVPADGSAVITIHCDATCILRNDQIASYTATLPAASIPYADAPEASPDALE